jgi:hypothetical protein
VNGRHEYVYLCAYDGLRYWELENKEGIKSREAFEHILKVARARPRRTHVIYGGSYDFNMLLRDVPFRRLLRLWEHGSTYWLQYRISLKARKELRLSASNTSVVLWDVIGFFQQTFLKAATEWPIILSDAELTIVRDGKARRAAFTIEELETTKAYCRTELVILRRIMAKLDEVRIALGLQWKRWDGAGSVANAYMKMHSVKTYKAPHKEGEYQSDWYTRVRHAYAGGRIEPPLPGDHFGPIKHIDVNSAYPSAIIHLPNLRTGQYVLCCDESCEIGPYDLVHIDYRGDKGASMHPFGHRSYSGAIAYPCNVISWRWGVEVQAALDTVGGLVSITPHYHFIAGANPYPFAWVGDAYAQRAAMKAAGDPREKIVKLGLNSIYGKLAQQSGWKEGRQVPPWHQLEWAGWITAYTRGAIWRAIADHTEQIIAIETDGIYSREALDVPVGKALGQWEVDTLDRITYVQSGVYVADTDGEDVTRSRGIDLTDRKGAPVLTRERIITAWEAYTASGHDSELSHMTLPSTRFITLGSALRSRDGFNEWRQWPVRERQISLLPVGKRIHAFDCHTRWGEGEWHRTVPLQPPAEDFPFAVKWVSAEEALRHHLLEQLIAEEREVAELCGTVPLLQGDILLA